MSPVDRSVEESESQELPEVGVGPWPGPLPPVGPDSPYDPQLLQDGDRRNVVDQYRYWSVAAIVADLDRRRHGLHIGFENIGHDLNVGSLVRTANAYNAAGVHVIGRRRWNRRGAMVTDRYLHIYHHPTVADLLQWAHDNQVTLVGVDNLEGSVPVETFTFANSCLLLFGTESSGLSAEALDGVQALIHITQHGSTRSLNVAAAGAITMFAWALQHAKSLPPPPPV